MISAVVTRAGVATFVGVATDREGFHKCQLFIVELGRGMQFVGSNQKAFAESAVDHHTDDIQ
jgi:hypothetical protein